MTNPALQTTKKTVKDKVEVYEEAVVMVQALGVDLVAAKAKPFLINVSSYLY